MRLNGGPMNLKALKKVMGFVPQDDTVFGDLTVRENISYRRVRLTQKGLGLGEVGSVPLVRRASGSRLAVRRGKRPSARRCQICES